MHRPLNVKRILFSLSLSVFVVQQPSLDLGFLIVEVSRSHTNTHTS